MTQKEKLSLAKKIIDLNNDLELYLSGSLMLTLMGIDLGREIKDIDICVADIKTPIILPEGCEMMDFNANYDMKILKMSGKDGASIDLINSYGQKAVKIIDGIPCADVEDLLLAKWKYVLAGNLGWEKHKSDIEIIEKSIKK